MGLKGRTGGHKCGGLVGRAGPNVQSKEKGCKGLPCLVDVLQGKGEQGKRE